MSPYTHLDAGWVLRKSDSAHIPPDPANRDYADYLFWVTEGGVPDPYSPPVPESVTPRQFRQALTRAGLRAAVDAAVAASDQDTKDWYEFASSFERTHPATLAVTATLGKTEADLDALFTLAATL